MAPSRILILGGGAAGWLSAAYLARSLPDAAITLVESPAIATVGVGEGSFPSLRNTLSFIGLDERAFLRDADAAFKQGVVFDGWKAAGTSYFHPFNAPHRAGPVDLAPYWLLRRAAGAAAPSHLGMDTGHHARLERRIELVTVAQWTRDPLGEGRLGGKLGHVRVVAGMISHGTRPPGARAGDRTPASHAS